MGRRKVPPHLKMACHWYWPVSKSKIQVIFPTHKKICLIKIFRKFLSTTLLAPILTQLSNTNLCT